MEAFMGANSTQGLAILVFLVAFTCLGAALFLDGNLLLGALFLVGLTASIVLFRKAKPLEELGG
jgi:hypothetical protein